jgi:hypothetical protein
MLPLSPFVPTFLAFIALAAANPISAPQPAPTTNKITHLYLCPDASFGGTCTNLHVEISECVDIPGDLSGKVSSAGPDEGTFCTMYS